MYGWSRQEGEMEQGDEEEDEETRLFPREERLNEGKAISFTQK